ncbi:hypothetical protein FACS1894217_11570 [Clostridia bacterium]|nr:hypothetical protein FACS1894217_11570 [Clostridia bacterium]
MADIVEAAKMAALAAVESTKPSGVYYGTVISASPLKINVEQKMVLEKAQLVLSRNVTEHSIEMTVNHTTDYESSHTHAIQDTYTGGGTSSPTSHRHDYTGRKIFTVHNGLVTGDKVILLREQGGQKYIVWDRVGT